MQREDWLEGRSGASNNSRQEEDWTTLWRFSVPSKVKIFSWRLARHSLPTTDVLKKRNMSTVDACPLCGREDSWRHALISCTMARCIWALSDSEVVQRMGDNQEPGAKNFLFNMQESLSHDQFTTMVVTLWSISYTRRKAVYEAIFQSPSQTNSLINSYLMDLRGLHKSATSRVPDASSGPRVAEVQRWLPPMGDKAKINVDGAVGRHGHCGVAAAICRDSTGLYLGSSLVVYAGITDPTLLEAFACREALALAEDLGIQMMHVASDCEEVVKC